MKGNQLLDIFHLLVQGHFQPTENLRNHSAPHHLVSMESPANGRIKSLADRFPDVVK